MPKTAKACLYYPRRTPCLSILPACPLDQDPGSLIQLIDNTREVIGKPPMYKDGGCTTLTSRLDMFIINSCFWSYFPNCGTQRGYRQGRYRIFRSCPRKLEAYVKEMASGDAVSGAVNIQKVQDVVLKLWSVVKALAEISSDQKNHFKSLYEGVVHSLNNPDSNPGPIFCSRRSSSQFLERRSLMSPNRRWSARRKLWVELARICSWLNATKGLVPTSTRLNEVVKVKLSNCQQLFFITTAGVHFMSNSCTGLIWLERPF